MIFTVQIKTIGDKIRVMRVAKHWTQIGLAGIARVNQMSVSRIERNIQIDKGDIQKILRALEITDEIDK